MGICSNCIFKGDKIADYRRNPHLRKQDYACKNENNSFVDYITGEVHPGTCRSCNGIGECLYFDDGTIPLYAWVGETTVYTLSENPDITDSYRDENMDILGQVWNVDLENRYAYTSISKTYFLLKEPEEDDDVFNIERNVIGKVTSVSEEEIKITVDEIPFIVTRDKRSDMSVPYITDSELNRYYRNLEFDTNYTIVS